MAVINNLQQFHSAIAAVCPIDGVGADGTIYYDDSASASQKQAAQSAASSYSDVAPQVITIDIVVHRMTDAEYSALVTYANNTPAMHRILHFIRYIDLALPQTQTAINHLVTAGVLTAARAQVVFAPPPVTPPLPPVQGPPPPDPVTSPV